MIVGDPVCLGVGELSFGWALACESDHAIKMIQGADYDHGQGSARYTQPLF